MEDTHKQASIRSVTKIFLRHSAKYPLSISLTLIFGTLVTIGEIIIPLFYKKFFDTLSIFSFDTSSASVPLVEILVVIFVFHILMWSFRRIGQFSYLHFEAKVMTDLLQMAFDKLIYHSYSFFASNFTGSLVRKITRLPKSFEGISDRVVYDLLPLIITLFGVGYVLFNRHNLLGLSFLIWVIVVLLVQYFLTVLKHQYRVLSAKKDSETGGKISDALGNEGTIKLFTGEVHEKTIIQKVLSELETIRLKLWNHNEWINLSQGALSIIIEFLLFYFAIQLWQEGVLTIGDFALIQAYIISAVSKLWNVGNTMRQLYTQFADAGEAVAIIEEGYEIKDRKNAKKLNIGQGTVQYKNVTFGFKDNKIILNDINLYIKEKEKIAFVGPSGAGKSTLVRLLLRLYDVSGGEILIDNQSILDTTIESLRENIAFVPQEAILFHRTLMENIRYGRRDATDEEVIESAKKAHCHEFIQNFPYKYNSLVGERGVKLSGGERQRIAIARAILKQAPILVLDEATSSLDSESESYIQEALVELMKDKTVIVIAHRLSTIMKMDRIIVIDEGKVVEEGTHKELISKEGIYKRLWSIQAGGFIPD